MALDAILRISEVEELAKKSAQEAAVQAKDLIRQAEADGQALMAQTRAVSASKAKDWMAEAEQAAAEQAREIDRQAQADCDKIAREAEERLPAAVDFIVQRIVSVPWPS